MLTRRLATAAVAAVAAIGLLGAPALADSTAIQINRAATRSPSHIRAFVTVVVACSPDTDSAAITAQLVDLTPAGTVQTANAAVANIGSFECSGDEETVTLPFRRPLGGYNWQAGPALVRNVLFITHDVTGTYVSFLKGRTVIVK